MTNLERLPDQFFNLEDIKRFGNEFESAGLHGFDGIVHRPLTCHDNRHQLRKLCGYVLGKADAVLVRKVDINQCQTDGILVQQMMGFACVSSQMHTIAGLSQSPFEYPADAFFIIQHQEMLGVFLRKRFRNRGHNS